MGGTLGREHSARNTRLVAVMLVMLGGLTYWDEQWIWRSIAIGMSTHLFRDTATGTVVLLWPFESVPVRVPYIV